MASWFSVRPPQGTSWTPRAGRSQHPARIPTRGLAPQEHEQEKNGRDSNSRRAHGGKPGGSNDNRGSNRDNTSGDEHGSLRFRRRVVSSGRDLSRLDATRLDAPSCTALHTYARTFKSNNISSSSSSRSSSSRNTATPPFNTISQHSSIVSRQSSASVIIAVVVPPSTARRRQIATATNCLLCVVRMFCPSSSSYVRDE